MISATGRTSPVSAETHVRKLSSPEPRSLDLFDYATGEK